MLYLRRSLVAESWYYRISVLVSRRGSDEDWSGSYSSAIRQRAKSPVTGIEALRRERRGISIGLNHARSKALVVLADCTQVLTARNTTPQSIAHSSTREEVLTSEEEIWL